MTDRIVQLLDLRTARLPLPDTAAPADCSDLHDQLRRPLHDLRISVTDRCNFRCTYCMPKEIFDRDYAFLPHRELLTFEEITRLARFFIALGVEKIRLTGGEPLLRKDLNKFIEMLGAVQSGDGCARSA